MWTLKNKMLLITQGANPTKPAHPVNTRDTCPWASVAGQTMTIQSKLEYLSETWSRQWQLNIRLPTTWSRPSTPSLICTQTSLVGWACPRAVIKIYPNSSNFGIEQLADTLNIDVNHVSGTNHHVITHAPNPSEHCPCPILHIQCNSNPASIKGNALI